MDGGWTASDAAELLRMPTASDDKYSRGVVGVRTGSTEYPGAAVLGVEAAWRAGIGMVRYVGPDRPTALVLQRRPETVTVDGRVQAWVIGSGTSEQSRADSETAALTRLLGGELPVIVDAGAIGLARTASAPVIVTPHDREHAHLRSALGLGPVESGEGRPAAARETAERLGACVVLKGSRTLVAAPDGWLVELPSATPWLATAGTGDVLAGVIGAVVAGAVAASEAAAEAGGSDADVKGRWSTRHLARLAATGVWLHARAGALAVAAASGGPVTALDVAAHLPPAVGTVHRQQ